MNRIENLFQQKSEKILNVYFTAGYPALHDTPTILKALQNAGVDLIEIGMPYSDPIADGETIQQSNQQALHNGMTLKLLFEQLKDCRKTVDRPILLMGYLNPVVQFGIENFCKKCQEVGIDGVILPDMPIAVYQEEYQATFRRYGLLSIFLITPQTTEERIRQIDQMGEGFIYMVSSASTTGQQTGISEEMIDYFSRVNRMDLQTPRLIGFGITDKKTFEQACQYAQGAIIGSAFIRRLQQADDDLTGTIGNFVRSVKDEVVPN